MDQSEIYREQRKRDDEILAGVQPRMKAPAGCKHPEDCQLAKLRNQCGASFPSFCYSNCQLPGAINDPARK